MKNTIILKQKRMPNVALDGNAFFEFGLLWLAIVCVVSGGMLIYTGVRQHIAQKTSVDTTPTARKTVEPPKRVATNKLGEAEKNWQPHKVPNALSIAPVELKRMGNKINIKLPLDAKGVPLVGPSVLVDADSGQIIWSYRADDVGEIASMSKMMLVYATYCLAESGVVSLFDTITVGDAAPHMGGSQAYLERGERYTLANLLAASTVSSCNDAAYQICEYIGKGDVIRGVETMNDFAHRLGLRRTKFYNAHGLNPTQSGKALGNGMAIQEYKGVKLVVAQKPNVSTPIEMAKLGIAFAKEPRLLLWSNISHDTLWDIDGKRPYPHDMKNHFKPVSRVDFDGIKTGYTSGSGFCVTATAMKNGRRLVAVVFDAKSQNIRDNFVISMIDAAFDSLIGDSTAVETYDTLDYSSATEDTGTID